MSFEYINTGPDVKELQTKFSFYSLLYFLT